MAVDEELVQRVRSSLARRSDVSEKKMFGGVCFMLNGNMLCGVDKKRLMFRVGKQQHAQALSRPGARPMDITGKPMAGFVFVDPEKCDKRGLGDWIALAENYVGGLPRKAAKARRRKSP